MGLRTGLPASLIRLTLIEHLLHAHRQALPLLCWGRHRVKNKHKWGDKMNTGLQTADEGRQCQGPGPPWRRWAPGPPRKGRRLRCVFHSFHELRRSICSMPQTPPGVRTLSGEPWAAPTVQRETEGPAGREGGL